MTTTADYTVFTQDTAVTVQAELIAPGLYVFKQHDTVDEGASCRWRIGHHSGKQIARFRTPEEARAAATALIDWVDWTGDSNELATHIAKRDDATDFLWIVEGGGGHIGNCAHVSED